MNISCTRALKAEFLKGKHSSLPKIVIGMPLICLLLAGIMTFMTNAFIQTMWNWWYSLLLPGMTVIVSTAVANLDARQKFRSIFGLAFPLRAAWYAKIAYCLALTGAANLIVLGGIAAISLLAGIPFDFSSSLLAAGLLTLTNAWIIPVSLAPTARFGTLAGILVPFLAHIILGFGTWSESFWWLFPPASSLCLVTPLLGILPNGLPALPNDSLAVFALPWVLGFLISLLFSISLTVISAHWFSRQETH